MRSSELSQIPADAWWSCVTEPADPLAYALRLCVGDEEARDWLLATRPAPVPQVLLDRVDAQQWVSAWERWRPRALRNTCAEELADLERIRGRLIRPSHPEWPSGLSELPIPPTLLWVQGKLAKSVGVGIVGARATTPTGVRVARELSVDLSGAGLSIISGGAFGIDVAAHRGALDAGGPTFVYLAGGLAKPYPAAHTAVFEEVLEKGGALVSEVPPSWRPAKWRFLGRNRLIAAHSHALVVVEAAPRSGALATARRAFEIGREVGAVPGPVTSMASRGCHELIRSGATLVRDAADVLDMIGPIGGQESDITQVEEPLFGAPVEQDRGINALPPQQRRVWEALPARSGTNLARLSRAAGLGEREVLAALAHLELRGLVRADPCGWARNTRTPTMDR